MGAWHGMMASLNSEFPEAERGLHERRRVPELGGEGLREGPGADDGDHGGVGLGIERHHRGRRRRGQGRGPHRDRHRHLPLAALCAAYRATGTSNVPTGSCASSARLIAGESAQA